MPFISGAEGVRDGQTDSPRGWGAKGGERFWSWSRWISSERGLEGAVTQLGALPGACSPFTSGSPRAREDPKGAEQPTGPSWVQSQHPTAGQDPVPPRMQQGGEAGRGPSAAAPGTVWFPVIAFFLPVFVPGAQLGAARLCLGLATAACNCSSSQTSVSLPQGWGWGCLGNAVGVVCLVVCSRNVGQTVKFFSPLVK